MKLGNVQFDGVSLLGLATVLFVGLKLAKVIDWAWVWVLSPVWIPAAVGFLLMVGVFVAGLIDGLRR